MPGTDRTLARGGQSRMGDLCSSRQHSIGLSLVSRLSLVVTPYYVYTPE